MGGFIGMGILYARWNRYVKDSFMKNVQKTCVISQTSGREQKKHHFYHRYLTTFIIFPLQVLTLQTN